MHIWICRAEGSRDRPGNRRRRGWRILLFVFLPCRDDDPSCPLPCYRRRPALAERLTATLHHHRTTGHFDAWMCPCPQWGVPVELQEPGDRVAQLKAHRSSLTDLDRICLTRSKNIFVQEKLQLTASLTLPKENLGKLLVLFPLTRAIFTVLLIQIESTSFR